MKYFNEVHVVVFAEAPVNQVAGWDLETKHEGNLEFWTTQLLERKLHPKFNHTPWNKYRNTTSRTMIRFAQTWQLGSMQLLPIPFVAADGPLSWRRWSWATQGHPHFGSFLNKEGDCGACAQWHNYGMFLFLQWWGNKPELEPSTSPSTSSVLFKFLPARLKRISNKSQHKFVWFTWEMSDCTWNCSLLHWHTLK